MRIITLLILFLFVSSIAISQRISGTVNQKSTEISERTLSTLPAGLIFYEGFDNITSPNIPQGWTTLSAGPSGFKTGTSGNSSGQANENGFWPVPLHGVFALTNDDVCNCNKSNDVLVSKKFNFSKLDYARIGFSAFQNGSNGQTGKLQIRHSEGNWIDLVEILASAQWEEYRITLALEYLKPNFQFRFRYSDNNGYASGLAIDDVFISSSPTEVFKLGDVYSISPDVEASGYFPDLMPKSQAVATHLQFSAKVESDSKKIKNARLSVDISGPLSCTDTSSNWILDPQSNSIIGMPKRETFTPYDSGAYTLKVELITDSADSDNADNKIEEAFIVSDSTFKWNTEPSDGTGIWILESLDRLGSIINITKQDTVRSAWIGIHPTTEVGARFKVKIFSFQTLTASIFTSSPFQVSEEDLNKSVRVKLNMPLPPGKYLIAIEKEANRLVINTTSARKSPFGVSYYKGSNQDWRHTGYYPDLAITFDPIDADCPAHIQAVINDESCPLINDGGIIVEAIDASQFHSKVWSNGSGDVDSIGGLSPGFYQVFVTDGECTYDRIFEIAASNPLSIDAELTLDTCSNGVGSMVLSSQASQMPHNYTINNIATTTSISGLYEGLYTISIENDLGCVSDTVINISGTDPLNVSINAQPSGCGSANGKIISSPSGTAPYIYQWSNGDSISTLTGVSSGIYHLSVYDSIGCKQVVTVLLADSNAPSIGLVDLTNNACADDTAGQIEVSATGGTGNLMYSWSNSDSLSIASNLPRGTYTLTVNDSIGCSNFGSYGITDISEPFNIDFIEEGINCYGNNNGRIEVLIQGGQSPYNFAWNPTQQGSIQLSDLIEGDYMVSVTDNQNCTQKASTTIISQAKFILVIDSLYADSSSNGQNDAGIYLSVFGGTPPYKYNWSNGLTTQDLKQVDTGFYSVVITDQFGCSLYYEKYLSNDPLNIESRIPNIIQNIFPNPVFAGYPINLNLDSKGQVYMIHDIHGRIICKGFLKDFVEQIVIKEPGIYFLNTTDKMGKSVTNRIVVL